MNSVGVCARVRGRAWASVGGCVRAYVHVVQVEGGGAEWRYVGVEGVGEWVGVQYSL